MHRIPVQYISNQVPWRLDVAELWGYRNLIVLLAWRNVRVRYKQTVLGLLWAVLAPLAFTAIFLAFFNIVSVAATGALPMAPAIFAGLMLWQFFSRALTDASTSLSSNANLITKVYFPRVVLPLASVLSSLADFVVSMALFIGMFLFYGLPFTFKVLWAPIFVLHTFALVLGIGLWFAAIDGIFRDLRHAIPLLLQLGMLISPVAYLTAAIVPEHLLVIYDFNPMVAPLEGFRWSLFVDAPAPSFEMLWKSLALTLVVLVSGIIFFNRVERTVVDRV